MVAPPGPDPRFASCISLARFRYRMSSLEAKLQAGTKEFQKIQTGELQPLALQLLDASRSSSALPPPLLVRHRSRRCVPDYGKAVEHRQRLDAQKSESEAVKKVRSVSLASAASLTVVQPLCTTSLPHCYALRQPPSPAVSSLPRPSTGIRLPDPLKYHLQASRPCPAQARPSRSQGQRREATRVHCWGDVRLFFSSPCPAELSRELTTMDE